MKKETKKEPKKVISDKLKKTIELINKDFGDGSIMKLGDKSTKKYDTISTGSIGLNIALGVGGIPRGRIVEIFGNESSGKSSMALHMIANAQKQGGRAAIIDAEFALDTVYAQNLGVNIDDLYINQPSFSEEGLEICNRLVESGEFSIIVIDSVAALVPKKELEGESGDSAMGVQARLMSQILRKITGIVAKTNTTVIFINQIREKIGVMFGSPNTTTGGRALAFYSSIRLEISKIGLIKDGDEAIGNRIKVKVVKNKVAPPFRTAEFDIIFGEGIDVYGELVDKASELDIILKSGSWYSYKNDKLGQGKEAVRTLLKDNDELYQEIKKGVESKIYV
jgi:recombination protein RecA